MNELYQQLMRGIPHRRLPDETAPGAVPRTLRGWIDALPIANFAATSSQLLDHLRAMNQVRIEPLQRLEMLEVLRVSVGQCISTVDAQILGSAFPLTRQKAELARLSEMFEFEISLGYIEVLFDLCAPKEAVPMFRGRHASLAAFRALEHAGQCLQKSYQCYHAPLAGIWQSMHNVYRVIVDLKLERKTVDGSRFGDGAQPAHVYAHALLLSLVNPYSFTLYELPEITAIIRLLAPFCELLEVGAEVEQTGTLRLVDTHSDVGPGFVVEDAMLGKQTMLGIDTTGVVSEIEWRINAASNDAHSLELPHRGGNAWRAEIRLLRHLVGILSADYSREFERVDSEQEMGTVIGLHDVHNVLADNEDFSSFAQRMFGSADSAEQQVMTSLVNTSSEQTRVCQQRANVLDQSLRGYRLRWTSGPNGETVRAKVGEVIGLRSNADSASNWIVGSIRWLRINEDGDVDAGVEVLARRALPVAVGLDEDTVPTCAPCRGLLLAPLRSVDAGIYSTLLVPSIVSPKLVDRRLISLKLALPLDGNRWWTDAGVLRLGATGLLDRSGSYIHFRLPSMRRAEAARDAMPQKPAVGAD